MPAGPTRQAAAGLTGQLDSRFCENRRPAGGIGIQRPLSTAGRLDCVLDHAIAARSLGSVQGAIRRFDHGRRLASGLIRLMRHGNASHPDADVPMSFADACLVRMTETLNDPMLLTTDTDFRIYRRHGRQVIPCMLPR